MGLQPEWTRVQLGRRLPGATITCPLLAAILRLPNLSIFHVSEPSEGPARRAQLGFLVTTLSTVGVRLWLMSPDRLAKLVTTMTRALELIRRAAEARWSWLHEKPLEKRLAEWARKLSALKIGAANIEVRGMWLPGVWAGLYQLCHIPMELPLNVLSPLKPSGLSWSGVVWRRATASMIAAYNLAFLPYIFLFSKQQLQGSVVVICHAAAVIVAVFVFPATVILLLLTARLFLYACLFLYRDLFYASSPQALESLQATLTPLTWVNMLLEEHGIPFPDALQGYSPLSLFNTLFGSFMDVLEFFATPKGEAIRFSDVIRVCVLLGTGEVKVKDAEGGQPLHGGRLMLGWKDASVNTIDTTGQLIPFIMGCKYPGWADVKLEVEDGVDGPVIFKIGKKEGGIKGDDNLRDGQTEGVVTTKPTRRSSV
ncbi:hypothetical protein EDB80DRAFT_843229 [Ilyonectria destructans]|nr:hypothetical protein EDB80DRAFT_843229 [Ilyonectria destructans]